RAFPLDQVRHCIQAEGIYAHIQPEPHHVPHFFAHRWIVPVQVWLMTEEAMPVVLLGNWVPSPVRKLRVEEDDSCAFVLGVGVAPHVPVATRIAARAA